MKKKFLLLSTLAAAICLSTAFAYCLSLSGNTAERREKLLDNAGPKGKNWSIVKEIEIDGYIVSAACSADDQAAIAVFKPTPHGSYRISSSTRRNNDEIIIAGAPINGQWYDLIWYHGAQTEYAEIIYSAYGKEDEILKYNTADMDIICIKNDEKTYTLSVCYYDSEGNQYK
ncbi:MAG: hypothetical protein ACOX60_10090 [Massiliimalia sp.]|jgi:hypothetical protein